MREVSSGHQAAEEGRPSISRSRAVGSSPGSCPGGRRFESCLRTQEGRPPHSNSSPTFETNAESRMLGRPTGRALRSIGVWKTNFGSPGLAGMPEVSSGHKAAEEGRLSISRSRAAGSSPGSCPGSRWFKSGLRTQGMKVPSVTPFMAVWAVCGDGPRRLLCWRSSVGRARHS